MKVFQAFGLDGVNRCLWREDQRLVLTPKAFDVLRYLVEHRSRLVTQDEILDAVWAETHVNPEVVKKAILEIRKTLGDRPDKPIFIETLRKRGYQFIAPVTDEHTSPASHFEIDSDRIVGRDAALSQLASHFKTASGGLRQIVFVTGEAGIGKTKLVDVFEQTVARRLDSRTLRGHCIEGFGGKEAFYPLLEALGQGARDARESLVPLLAKIAPGWLLQFPALLNSEQRDALQREALGTTRERMVREVSEVLEAITAQTPLLLILEDLHWADPSTVDVISALARRREPSRLLLIGTYRPTDILGSANPLRTLTQDLLIHKLCDELALQPLDQTHIEDYLARTLPDHRLPPVLSGLIHRQSGGNPLFMSAVIEGMVKRSLIVQEQRHWTLSKLPENLGSWVPETLEQMLRAQFEQLDERERRILTSGSVAGERFSVWAVSGMLEADPDVIETACKALANRNLFIHAIAVQPAPDGSPSAHYEFRHALYRQALYGELSSLNRSKLHRSLGERLKNVAHESNLDLASEIALHFEKGRDYEQAVNYLVLTAEHALQRFAHRDAIQVLRRAIEVLRNVAGRQTSLEIAILRRIANASYASGEMEESAEAYEQAVVAANEAGEQRLQIECLISLAAPACYCDLKRGLDVCARAVALAGSHGDPLLSAQAQMMAATCRLVYEEWSDHDSKIYDASLAAIRSLNASAEPGHDLMLHAYVRTAQGDYRGALERAESAIRQMTSSAGSAGYLPALGAKTVSLLHLGKFGDVLRIVRMGREIAEKNDMDPWIFVFREAWLRTLCFDFEGARQLGTVKMRSNTQHHAAQPRTIALVAAGQQHLEQRNYIQALECFAQVADQPATPKFFLHWRWRIQAQIGIATAWLESGNVPQARDAAARSLESALATADPYLRVLALEISARAAFAGLDKESALQQLRHALAITEQFDVPVAAWRVHAAAWELFPDGAEAEQHRSIARDIISSIADSFDDDEPLRASLMSADAA